jgi:hypothetical protein
MEKKTILGLGLLIAVLIIGGAIAYNIYIGMETDTEEKQVSVEEPLPESYTDNLNTSQEYLGDNLWRYKVTGTLPNPCYEISVEAEVTEEEGQETAIIYSKITAPTPDMVCAQVIQEVYEEGEFEASEDASILFSTEW